MTQVVVDFPDALFRDAQAFAQKEKTSIDKLLISLLGEKLNSLMADSYLAGRAKRGDRNVFLSVLDAAEDNVPNENDRL